MNKRNVFVFLFIFCAIFLVSGFAEENRGEYIIGGIIFSKENPAVLINGNIYKLNDSVCAGKITNISPEEVTISFQGIEKKFKAGAKIEAVHLEEHRRESAIFTKPSGWTDIPASPAMRGRGFYTSDDPASRLIVTARVINVPNQTVFEWAVDEIKSLKSSGKVSRVFEPQTVKIGDFDWVLVEWEGSVVDGKIGGLSKGQQYYSKKSAKYTLIEICFMGPKKSFDTVMTKEIYEFISSVKIDTRNKNEITKNAYWDYIAKEVTKPIEKKAIKLKKGDIVNGFLAIKLAFVPPAVGEIIDESSQNVIFYSKAHILVDGKMVFSRELIEHRYKVLTINKLTKTSDYQKSKDYYEVKIEILD